MPALSEGASDAAAAGKEGEGYVGKEGEGYVGKEGEGVRREGRGTLIFVSSV